ncbi:oxygen-insensitive NAD(P)H nitroreductase [Clostridium nigeriense]|uniref:oxygen-insensitive NAD(P)H nitroreductase n=1 Tax=Clostridium nigeriense TaxID=1805470 RepID=UPI000830142E|nr:oxygen-insensitive NAD(P)H nitroreductase [Clostridium nigeriense]
MNLIEIMNNRYSTKKFDKTKKISEENIKQIKELLRLSSSSVNLQPWHFVIASTEEGKNNISKSTEGFFAFNKEKVVDASHVIVLCSKTSIDDEFLQNILEKENQDGRFANEEFKNGMHSGRSNFVNIHKDDAKDLQEWVDKQVYLNLGNLLLGVAALGIDAVPMEGFDSKILSEELELDKKGLKPIAIVPIGYRAEDDFNAILPKSRLNEDEIFTII